jgi:hypothetical protein
MNIDLKRVGGTYSSPPAGTPMPKTTAIRRPTDTVFMFDFVFSPTLESLPTYTSPQFNAVNPAGRWRSFASRHSTGGEINFIDSHVGYYKTKVVQDGGTPSGGPAPQEFPGSPVIWNPPYRVIFP